MGETTGNCVKWLMFTFNVIFWIIGIGLIAAGAIAQSSYKEYFHLMDTENVSITAPVMLIIIGVVIFIISFLGCAGAVRESYPMLLTFSVFLGIIFVLQVAGGIAGYVQKGKVEDWIRNGLKHDIDAYRNTSDPNAHLYVDQLQQDLKCCGAEAFGDWSGAPAANRTNLPPKSCCKIAQDQCNITKDTLVACSSNPPGPDCNIYTTGCMPQVVSILGKALAGVAGVALGLAVIELIGIIFACYLIKRVRSGYTYA